MTDPSTRELLEALSVPMAADDAGAWTRRRFLAATAATGAAATVLPAWLGDVAESATPIGPNDGVVVVILMGGGNDGLNMVPPVGNGRYHDLRKGIAIDERTALDIGQGHGLHPALTGVAARWAKGEVAVVHGVGDVAPDLSHFAAMARWMSAITTGAPTSSGWLGRWLDGYGRADDLAAIALGSSVPLTLVGAARKATALPSNGGGGLLGKHEEPWVERSIQCMREMGAGATGTGAWADALAAAGRGAMDMAEIVQPVYAAPLGDAKLTAQLQLAARLINSNLGVRVIHASYGDFDSHAGQPGMQDARMRELDAALTAFFATLDPRWARRTTVMTMSEFGRRAQANLSAGTDHGEGSDLLVMGAGVKGGHHGQPMDLRALTPSGSLKPTVDFRAVYATVLETALGADAGAVLGGRFEHLGFLKRPSP